MTNPLRMRESKIAMDARVSLRVERVDGWERMRPLEWAREFLKLFDCGV